MATHARLGPSGAAIWTECTASPRESDGKPNDGNDASRMGTACHGVVAECLMHDRDPHEYFGRNFLFCIDSDDGSRVEDFDDRVAPKRVGAQLKIEHTVVIDSDMVDYCVSYVNFVRDLVESTGATMLVEQRVPIQHITGEEGAGGTSDVILMYGSTIHTIDAKFGRNKVTAYDVVRPSVPDPISGDPMPPLLAPNKQMAMYASGALEEHGLFGDFDTVRMTIVQPPLNNVSEYSVSVDALNEFVGWLRERATETRTNPQFQAGDHCTYCKGRVGCAARDKFVIETTLEGFTDCTDPAQVANARPVSPDATLIGVYYERMATVKKWLDDIPGRVLDLLKQGRPVVLSNGEPLKLVAGSKGDRAWDDPDAVERLLKERMRLRNDQMYRFKLLSPAQVEKDLVKVPKAKKGEPKKEPVLGERQWTTLLAHITQADGSPSIAPANDPRPALPGVTDGFEEVPNPTAAEPVDLFN